jgi:hypothetical protein
VRSVSSVFWPSRDTESYWLTTHQSLFLIPYCLFSVSCSQFPIAYLPGMRLRHQMFTLSVFEFGGSGPPAPAIYNAESGARELPVRVNGTDVAQCAGTGMDVATRGVVQSKRIRIE